VLTGVSGSGKSTLAFDILFAEGQRRYLESLAPYVRQYVRILEMGATERSIRKIFVFNGMVIGSLGTILGLCLGLVVCAVLKRYDIHELTGDIYYFTTTLPVKLEFTDVVSIIAAALLICFFATLYPARQAAKLSPVEAIRYG